MEEKEKEKPGKSLYHLDRGAMKDLRRYPYAGEGTSKVHSHLGGKKKKNKKKTS